MIVIGLMGGLGNQMFQYACAKAAAKRLNKKLKIDVTMLLNRKMNEDFTYRNYELSPFNITEKSVTRSYQKLFAPDLFSATDKEKRKWKRIRRLLNYQFYCEQKEFVFEDRIKEIKNNTYLFGYFQTEKYFKEIRKDLLISFRLKEPLDTTNELLLTEIRRVNSVSIHVRRGDYLKSVNSTFQLLTFDNYYNHAIEEISKKVESPHFFVFSDDPDSIRNEFSTIGAPVTFVSHNNGAESYKDMVLMSCCKHNIIANSSFSWWGAWLNERENKTVIAPSKWFNNESNSFSTIDLLPKEWNIQTIDCKR